MATNPRRLKGIMRMNKLIYDPARKDRRKCQSFCTGKHYAAEFPLLPPGLLNPAKLRQRHVIDSKLAARN